jgi:outer membrane protein
MILKRQHSQISRLMLASGGMKAVSRKAVLLGSMLGVIAMLPHSAAAQSKTLQDALAASYSNNPALQAARALLRATDEGVPTALAGWRPTVILQASGGPAFGTQSARSGGIDINSKQGRALSSATGTVTQPIYTGGKTVASTNKATNLVYSQRAKLIAAEEQLFANVVSAYVGVIQAQDILALDVNNEQVLARQLQATNDRFRVGEITRTDVAQAEAALAGAAATRQTAEGNLQVARATYQQYVGEVPGTLVDPQPLKLPAKTLEDAKTLASDNNPTVIAAEFQNASDKDNFDLQYSALMPNVNLQASGGYTQNSTQEGVKTREAQIIASLSVPLYQGGAEYSAIRQARQSEQQSHKLIDDAKRTAVQQAISAWETYEAAKSTIDSTRSQIRSNQIALEGTQREAIVGSRTTLDVLNAEQLLLNSRTTLVQNLAALVTASYQVSAAVGRLTARDLALQVPYYDETAYFDSVRNRLMGTGDYATGQPGR